MNFENYKVHHDLDGEKGLCVFLFFGWSESPIMDDVKLFDWVIEVTELESSIQE